MSAWKRIALEKFPPIPRHHLQNYSIYELFFELLPLAKQAHAEDDKATLANIYSFAEWCLKQKDDYLWNAVAVAFYEHLFDDYGLGIYGYNAISYLSPYVILNCGDLWEHRLGKDNFKDVAELLKTQLESYEKANK